MEALNNQVCKMKKHKFKNHIWLTYDCNEMEREMLILIGMGYTAGLMTVLLLMAVFGI